MQRCSHHKNDVTCAKDVSGETVVKRCEGRGECVIPANNSEFGDPCPGTYKYLEIIYKCVD